MKKNILFGVWTALSVLCLIYGITLLAVGAGTLFFAVWIGLAFIFAIFSAVVKRDMWRSIPRGLRIAFIAVFCVGLTAFTAVEGCIISGFDAKGEDNLDCILVLGAQVYKSGPSAVLKCRLDKAAQYLQANPQTVCIVSGGQGNNEPFAEAVGMADYLKEIGISEDRIILETQSSNTMENIVNSKVFIDEGASVGIITSNFHMFRAVQTAKWGGLENICAISADTPILYLPNNMFREFFGEVKFLIKSRL